MKQKTKELADDLKKKLIKIGQRVKEPVVHLGKVFKVLWNKIIHPKEDVNLPPRPHDIHVHYVLYAKQLTANIDCSKDYKTLSKHYKKRADLFFFLDREKQKRNGTGLSSLLIKKIQPKGTNFINMAYIKGHAKVIPIDSAASDILNFMACLKHNGADFNQIYFDGDDDYVESLKLEMGKILAKMK